MNNKSKRNTPIQTLYYFFSKMWLYRKDFYLFFGLYIIMMIIQPLVSVFCPRYIIDEISTEMNTQRLISIVAFMIVCTYVVNLTITFIEGHLTKVYYEDFNRFLEANLGKKCMEIEYAAVENKQTLDQINNAKLGISNGYSGGMNGLFKSIGVLFSNSVILFITSLVVMNYSWWLLLIIIVNVAINAFMSNQLNKIQLAQFEKQSFINRGYNFLLHTLSDIRYGKDIRLFNTRRMMISRVDAYNVSQSEITRQVASKSQKYITISNLNLALTTIFTHLILAVMAAYKLITIGQLTMLVTSSSILVLALSTILEQVLSLKKFVQYAEKYVEFQSGTAQSESGDKVLSLDSKINIEYRNVSYKYPGQEKYALKNINIKIASGEHWSIVGLNGAGKTTFIKLLCRMYKCTEGEILINGTNILEYDEKSYRRLLAVVFQDFQLLNFTIKENIIAGDYNSVDDATVMDVVREVGLSDKVESLELGLATPVFRYYDMRGFEPSGGEQQKIAMARALFKDAPVLILDEPTAALDPVAEVEIYERYNDITRGKTALFISHRLASCQFCDCIMVFKDGEIVECGTHNVLLEIEDGLYAQMFIAQAQHYD